MQAKNKPKNAKCRDYIYCYCDDDYSTNDIMHTTYYRLHPILLPLLLLLILLLLLPLLLLLLL